MARHKNTVWGIPDQPAVSEATLGVLMDIRDELQTLNRTLSCHRIPRALDAVDRIDRRLQNSGVLVGKKPGRPPPGRGRG